MIFRKETYAHALARGARRLKVSPTAQLDARVLLSEASGLDRAQLIAADREAVPEAVLTRYAELLRRRREGEPVAYITGRQEFYGRPFAVNPSVLIPRPESEMLVEAALAAHPQRVLDLGTGSGCLLLSALSELPRAEGVGTDVSREALSTAERNRTALRLDGRARFELLSFADTPLSMGTELFDVILANPPYIAEGDEQAAGAARFEPHSALFSGEDGLEAHREVAQVIARLLHPSGSAFIEIGYDQGESAEAIYKEALPGRSVLTKKDHAGYPRMVAVTP
ncbi:peptide chain release factor N(5)-glutamine methyltransferase [Parvularcula maris]|uniref:Release factor glutamine methyltransferase n=1 Tax=Parvularcula maris TaxID=2965077 RepID=A0A9X2L8V9_9PROT|nr:peptide chain release factor N(5)-glutamine methyltransferase [Parvularcula maris]MCQ8185126.1 peptide chain release factor N(5)-glutamine methyltransferase [Parvularcula maris]